MERLELLSLVIPAFGAFARECMQNGRTPDERDYAGKCHQEIVCIGSLIYSLGREWRLGLDTSILDDLFKVLVKQIVKPKGKESMFRVFPRRKVCQFFLNI
jgi:hypothetical protein